ncbi:MAG: VOC family protein [Arthrobacter sp.]|uniref:VOC family protein n=1 Tax=Arthrobacter sp. 179 TaxID=3457734 RepID=UPI003FB6626D
MLGFVKKNDLAVGTEGAELRLEPSGHPAAKPFKEALVADGIPFTQFAVADVQAEYERLRSLGVRFTQDQ